MTRGAKTADARRPRGARLPHAGRVGAARGDLDRLAAQRDDWPGKFAPIPWVYAEIVRHLAPASGSASSSRSRRREARARRAARRARASTWRRSTSSAADRPRLDARHLARCSWSTTRDGDVGAHRLAVQRLGEVRQPPPRRRHPRPPGAAARPAALDADGRGRRRGAPGRAGRAAPSTSTARGTLLTTEECLLERGPGAQPGLDRARSSSACSPITSACATCSGSAAASPATTPTATSTTWPGSSPRGRSSLAVEPDPADANHEPLAREPASGSRRMRPGRPAAPTS